MIQTAHSKLAFREPAHEEDDCTAENPAGGRAKKIFFYYPDVIICQCLLIWNFPPISGGRVEANPRK